MLQHHVLIEVLRLCAGVPRLTIRGMTTLPKDPTLDEVRALRALPQLAAHPAPLDLPAIRAVGYRQAWEFLDDGEADPAGFRERAIAATRQLAKRQTTWLRGELGARWFDPECDGAHLERALSMFLG